MKKILVTSMNGPISFELVSYLKNFFYVIGCDCQPFGLGNKICDEFYLSPKGNTKKFLNFLKKFEKKVDQIFLFADEELLNVSKNRKKIGNIMNKVLISPHKTIEICNNKQKMKNFFETKSYKPQTRNEKIIIKPKIGRGSKNQIITSNNTNKYYSFFSLNDDFIIEKFIEGQEYTIDCLFDKKGKLFFALPRKRIIKSNLSIVGKISKNYKILNFIKKLSKKIKFIGNVNIQVIIDSKNKIHLTDINPRVSGSIIFSIMAGFDPFSLAFLIKSKKKATIPKNINYEKTFYRYWKTFSN